MFRRFSESSFEMLQYLERHGSHGSSREIYCCLLRMHLDAVDRVLLDGVALLEGCRTS